MGNTLYKLLGTGGAVAAGVLANKLLAVAWRKARGDVPTNPESDETSWAEAITWALVSGATIGVARLAWRKNAADYYRKSTGHLPAAAQGS
ncbi:DUF4235 domain-containing protein [Pseudokineococcus sp. 1T1Z-3]|uniref:DUF4235 domain-containing protein n=1 Tax=Pseudokineococcus sp. 1T1Z-3 TaxID=3132745 RepID=UPI0030A43341